MFSDLKFALRLLAKTPGFTLIAIVTLALGIGSATTAFTAVNALLLRPLPFIKNQDRLLHISETVKQHGVEDAGIALDDFLDWQKQAQSFDGIFAHHDRTVILAGPNSPERLLGSAISHDAFDLMGVQPLLGRNFRAADEDPANPPVALLSHSLWQKSFGGDPAVIGSTVTLSGEPTMIIGVMPPGWKYPEISDLWSPLSDEKTKAGEVTRGNFYLGGKALLKPGVTIEQAQAELDTLMAGLAKAYPETNDGIGARVRPVREEAVQDSAHLTWLIFAAVIFVFLIACTNVANLLLARAATRSKEIAVRLALGATPARLLRQLLTESVVLGLLGGIGGLLVALWGVDLMVAAMTAELPFWLSFDFDPTVFGFVLLLSIVASALFGIAPAFAAVRPGIVDEIKEGGRTSGSQGARGHRLRQVLVSFEIAAALVLLVCAGLMMRSFLHLRSVNPGFDAANVLTFRTGFPASMAGDKAVHLKFFTDLRDRLTALPGVKGVGVVSMLPASGQGGIDGFSIEGRPEPVRLADAITAENRTISNGYLEAMRIPLKNGRLFDTRDRAENPRVAIVDEVFARRVFGDESPLGKRVRAIYNKGASETPSWLEIVGVVGAVRSRLDRDEQRGTVYTPMAQHPLNFMSVVMRTAGDPEAFVDLARTEVLAVNKELPIYHVSTMDRVIRDTIWFRSFFAGLFTAFAVVALFLAAIGIYGVMAYSVTQRTSEIGVRMPLGAQPAEVVRMVVGQGVRLVGYGLGSGFVAAFFAAQLLAGSLYGVSPRDPPTFALVPALLAFVALLACYLPSRRATRIDPLVALRAE